MSTKETKETDITVYGATSFVAKHILRYLLQASSHDAKKLRITLGGRTQSKLAALHEDLKARENGDVVQDVFIAEGDDLVNLKKMARRTKVVLNCAGPYSAYSSGVVAACVAVGTDYVDITGEVAWVAEMRRMHGKQAKLSGARIISLCGYDSVPSDICVFAAVEALRERRNGQVNIESANIYHQMFGIANGGTVQTAVDMPVDLKHDFLQKEEKSYKLRKIPFFMGDPLCLTHPRNVRHNPDFESTKNRLAFGEWWNQLVHIDRNFGFGVSLPMPMAAINLKVVQASSVALNYGKDFTVKERYLPLGLYVTRVVGIMALIPMLLLQLGILCMVVVLRAPWIGKKLATIIAPAGSGPPDRFCEMGSNGVYAMVTAKPEYEDSEGKVDRAYAYISMKGDAGNLVTAQCVSESALALVLNRAELPERSEDGFGTPAELLGKPLLKRLKENKVRPVEVSVVVRKGTHKTEMKIYIGS
jgi:short subunit dehydrogenase-like uncharacterized protein